MDLKTFSAATMGEALQQVKSNMGHDAVILHTRTLSQRYWLGIRRREIVEITAGRGLNVPDRRRAASAPAPRQPYAVHPSQASQYLQPPRPRTSDYPGGYNAMPAAFVAPAALPAAPVTTIARTRQEFLETPAAANATLRGLSQDVTSLTSLVKDLVTEVRHKQAPEVPDELFTHYMNLIENQVAAEIAIELIKMACAQLRPDQLTNEALVKEKIAEQVDKFIPVAGPITSTKQNGPHVVALIGPTGVGKTTTLAKLAANLKLRERRRVGLITLDTYRIAAVDQLKKYADIIGSPIRAVSTVEELQQALASMSDCEFILIDTAGRSPNDTMKLGELKQLLQSIGPDGPDEVHLVLSTTASQACVELAIARFGDVRVDKIIFTKLDEAAHVGVLLNVVRKVNKSLSYVTTGQDVPNDIEVGKGRMLARWIMGADTV